MTATTDNLSELQKDIFKRISNNETAELKALLAANKIKIDFVDKNGMYPLQHAAYKGNKEIVQLLLDQGADVNLCQHEHKYTALHFAALSGNPEVCHLLMCHGAKLTTTNSVGRTAAQMAAFVGNHNCVAAINNYIPKANIDYYIKPQGLQKEPMLPVHLADSFHKFIMQVNVHPVRVAMTLQTCSGLIDYLPKIQKVLESMCHREMSKSSEANEIIAFKYHYLSCVIGELIKCQKRQEARKTEKTESEKLSQENKNKDDEKNNDNHKEQDTSKRTNKDKDEKTKTDLVELFIRALLKCNKADGFPEYQEAFLREVVREFPFRESIIFRQLVAALAGSDPPPAASIISAAINGQRGFSDNSQSCVTCSEERANKKCSKCKAVQYCDRECQRLHWFLHKKECARVNGGISGLNFKASNIDKADIANAVKNEIESLKIE
ncbi:ankyrin repeat and MYND domain-containing protein 2 [Chelonus insularis]|uniref:ankyrin repeat and MYND domain-containing protein 2 n=1 Tax=Chelonus insularis TaxID=460826 RepID=UPI00158B1FA0|nr:ankyrin repeat and MYND domain-containing protein 2 [Chelonus insularis]